MDLSHYSIAELTKLINHPSIAEPMKAKLRAELDGRGTPAAKKKPSRDLPTDTAIRANLLEGGGLELQIVPVPPSSNAIKRALYHQSGKYQYQRYLESLELALTGVRARFHFDTIRLPVNVEHFWRVRRARDQDSFGLSLKPILDALERSKILQNDGLARLVFAGQEHAPPANRELRLRITLA